MKTYGKFERDIRPLAEQGLSAREIALRTDTPRSTLDSWLRKNGFAVDTSEDRLTYEELEGAALRGYSQYSIAKELGVPVQTLRSYARKFGIALPQSRGRTSGAAVGTKKEVIRAWLKGATLDEIASDFGMNPSTVRSTIYNWMASSPHPERKLYRIRARAMARRARGIPSQLKKLTHSKYSAMLKAGDMQELCLLVPNEHVRDVITFVRDLFDEGHDESEGADKSGT